MYNSAQNQKGFTLVELLIVIVIIGILAGIVISILDPVRQQNRARDGVVVATINKIVAEARAQAAGDISGQGYAPSCTQLISALQNVSSSTACTGLGNDAQFVIGGVATNSNPSPLTGAQAYSGFRYRRASDTSADFCVSAVANDRSGFTHIVYDPTNISGSGGTNFTTPNRVNDSCY